MNSFYTGSIHLSDEQPVIQRMWIEKNLSGKCLIVETGRYRYEFREGTNTYVIDFDALEREIDRHNKSAKHLMYLLSDIDQMIDTFENQHSHK